MTHVKLLTTSTILWANFKHQQTRLIGNVKTYSPEKYVPLIDNWAKKSWEWDKNQPRNSKLLFSNQRDLWPLFLQNWKIFRPKTNNLYNVNREFRLFFLTGSSSIYTNSLISTTRYFNRWLDAYNLLFNLFYLESFVQVFSNKIFMEESLVFNWHYGIRNYKIFKLIQPFFFLKDTPHGESIHSAIRLLLSRELDFILLIDIRNHIRFLHYLQMYSVYVVGLVPINYSPWKVSYPIPAFSDSQINQYYFIRWIFYIQTQAKIYKRDTRSTQWLLVKKLLNRCH